MSLKKAIGRLSRDKSSSPRASAIYKRTIMGGGGVGVGGDLFKEENFMASYGGV